MKRQIYVRKIAQLKQLPPCVSLVVPITPDTPLRGHNKTLLMDTVKEALVLLAQDSSPNARLVEKKIVAYAEMLSLPEQRETGIVIYVNAEHAFHELLFGPLRQELSVGQVFSLRPLLQYAQPDLKYHLLVLSKTTARLIVCHNREGTEIITPVHNAQGIRMQGFPLDALRPSDKVVASVAVGDRGGDYPDHEVERFFRRVDQELLQVIKADRSLSLVIAALPKQLAQFTAIAQSVKGYTSQIVHLSHDCINDDVASVVEKGWLALCERTEEDKKEALAHARESRKPHATGIIRIAELLAAHKGRIMKLFIEEGLKSAGRRDPENKVHMQLFDTIVPGKVGYVSDLLLNEAALQDTELFMMPAGSLQDAEGLYALLRY